MANRSSNNRPGTARSATHSSVRAEERKLSPTLSTHTLSPTLSHTRSHARAHRYPGLYSSNSKVYDEKMAYFPVVCESSVVLQKVDLGKLLPVSDEIEPAHTNMDQMGDRICKLVRIDGKVKNTREPDPVRMIRSIDHYLLMDTDEESYASTIDAAAIPDKQFGLYGYLLGIYKNPGSFFYYTDESPANAVTKARWDSIFQGDETATRFRHSILFLVTLSYWCHVNQRILVPDPSKSQKVPSSLAHSLVPLSGARL